MLAAEAPMPTVPPPFHPFVAHWSRRVWVTYTVGTGFA
jgi:hypothetical protein